jgi:uncharacterized protein YjbI with pentapeptide repeats
MVTTICFWYMLAACTYAGEKPTREAIVAYNDACKTAGVQADFIAKFGSDFAGLDLHDVDFSGPHAVGKESILRDANFRGANLRGANFGAAQLERASFREADLRDAQFVTANLSNVNLVGAQLAGATIRESKLSHANAAGVDFAGVDLSGCDFPFADLREAKFAGATNDYWSDFTNANLASADLTGFRASAAQFYKANLRGANFTRADIRMADFHDAELEGAVFDGAQLSLADFRHARGLSEAQRRELLRKSGIVAWERIRMVAAFLDSPWFPLLLVVVLPALGWLYRQLTHGADAAAHADGEPRFQFTLANLLTAMFIVAALIGTALWSLVGLYSLVMVLAGYAMVHAVLYDQTHRPSAKRLLGVALGYVAANVVVGLTLSWISWEVSVICLVFLGIIIGPLSTMVGGTLWASQTNKLPTAATIGFIVWLIGAGFANLWALATLMAID